jgi:hypothetical protein
VTKEGSEHEGSLNGGRFLQTLRPDSDPEREPGQTLHQLARVKANSEALIVLKERDWTKHAFSIAHVVEARVIAEVRISFTDFLVVRNRLHARRLHHPSALDTRCACTRLRIMRARVVLPRAGTVLS